MKKPNITIDAFGRTRSIDDFKETQAYKKYRELCEKSAKARKKYISGFGGKS